METWPSPKTWTARSHAAKYASMPVRDFAGATRASTCGVERLDVDADGVDPHVADLVDDVEVQGRFELHLDRQPARLLDGLPAPRDVARPAVDAARTAGRQGGVDGAVQLAGGDGDLGEHRGGLLDDGAARLERQSDAAELALVVVAPVRAGLHHRAGEGVQVQQRDLLVGDAVRGRAGRRTAAAARRAQRRPAPGRGRRRTRRPRPAACTARPRRRRSASER